jgi:hypothetical protein
MDLSKTKKSPRVQDSRGEAVPTRGLKGSKRNTTIIEKDVAAQKRNNETFETIMAGLIRQVAKQEASAMLPNLPLK